MDAKKFLELQTQIKQNNHEYLEFINELDSWKVDLDKKREKIQQQGAAGKQPGPDGDLPPVRNSLMKKKLKKKVKKKPAEEPADGQSVRKISGYDYRAWDKFDVDKACEDVDRTAPSKSDESDYETDEEWEEERRKQLAESKKQAGNQAFKEERYAEAVEHYTKAVLLNPEDPIYYCNRAMALLKLDSLSAAVEDCNAALELDSKMVKAYYRRGQARLKLGKLPESLRDFEEALALEPSNRTLQTEVKELRLRVHPEKYATGEVQPIFDKPADRRSPKPLIRVPVEEVSAAKAAAAAAKLATTGAGVVAGAQNQESESKVNASESSAASRAAPAAPAASSISSSQLTEVATPDTPFHFKAAQRTLARHDPAAFCQRVLCAVEPPERLPVLIGESLESDSLLDIARSFLAGLEAQPVLAGSVLIRMRLIADKVKRFNTCVAFLSASEKSHVAELLRRLLALLTDSAAEVRELAGAYGVADCLS